MVILTTFPPPEEGIQLKQDDTQAHIAGRNLGDGTLYIAESRVSWVNKEGQGFSLEYPAVSLHAISRDVSSFPHECLYLMMDGNIDQYTGPAGQEQNEQMAGSEDEDSNSNISEIRFVPADSTRLKEMYDAMCTCQALHPDEDDSISGDEEAEGQYYDDESGAVHLTEGGQAVLDRLEGVFEADEPTFDPAGVADPVVGGNMAHNANGQRIEDADEAMEMGQFDDVDQQGR